MRFWPPAANECILGGRSGARREPAMSSGIFMAVVCRVSAVKSTRESLHWRRCRLKRQISALRALSPDSAGSPLLPISDIMSS